MLNLFSGRQLGFVISFLLATAIVGGLWFYDQTAGAKPVEEAASDIDRSMRIAGDTVLEQIYFYQKCQEREIIASKPANNLIGLDYRAFQQQYDEWNIETFSSNRVVMSLNVDDYCREHKANMFLGEKDGKVAVFYGRPDKKPILKEVTDMPVGTLQEQAVAEIKQGLPFSSKAEMLYILEGMQAK